MADPSISWMQEALVEAAKALALKEVPVGAVAVCNGEIVARAHNLRQTTNNPLGHAEMLLLQQLPFALSSVEGHPRNWRFTDITVVVTLEPCVMCMGALLQARIPKLIYGCKDPKAGACGSVYDFVGDKKLPHRMEVISGIAESECRKLLQDFFVQLRK